MMNLNLSFVASGLLLSVAAGQYVVTVSRGTCLPELGSMSFISPGGPGPSAIPAGPGIMSTKPCVYSSVERPLAMKSSNLVQRIEHHLIGPQWRDQYCLANPAGLSDQLYARRQCTASS